MKILLVHTRINYDNMEPLGLLSLATALKRAGFQTSVLDIFPQDDLYFCDWIHTFAPDLIGFGFETPGVRRTRELIGLARCIAPEIQLCAGGIHTSVLPQTTLHDLDLDFVVVGEAEGNFPLICQALQNGRSIQGLPGVGITDIGGSFHLTPPPPLIADLDALAPVDRSLLHGHRFYFEPPGCVRGLVRTRAANILASRGCPYNCTFCQSDYLMGKEVRLRSVASVIREIKELRERYEIGTIYFADDGITVDRDWIERFCEHLLSENLDIGWGCQSRADCLSPERVNLMKRAGCLQIDMGIESGDPEVLGYLNKSETPRQYLEAAGWIRGAGMRLLCSFVIGTPVETSASYEKTSNLIQALRPSMCQYFTLVPYPGTDLARQALETNALEHLSFSERGSQKLWAGGSLRGNLSREEQVRMKAALQRTTFLRDHLSLVLGWARYPRHVFRLARVIFQNGFFLRSAFPLRRFNPVEIAQTIYHAYNRDLLQRARSREMSPLALSKEYAQPEDHSSAAVAVE